MGRSGRTLSNPVNWAIDSSMIGSGWFKSLCKVPRLGMPLPILKKLVTQLENRLVALGGLRLRTGLVIPLPLKLAVNVGIHVTCGRELMFAVKVALTAIVPVTLAVTTAVWFWKSERRNLLGLVRPRSAVSVNVAEAGGVDGSQRAEIKTAAELRRRCRFR